MPASLAERVRQAARQAAAAAPPAAEGDAELRVDVGVAQEAAAAEPEAGPQAPAPPAAAPAPAAGRPVATVVDPNNPRTPREDADRIFQWVGTGRAPSHEETITWIKQNFTFTTKCQGGWYWFRKPWHLADTRCDRHNPRTIAEDVDHKYQWSCNVANMDGNEWNYCGQDKEGQRWYRRPWPKPDANNPRRPEDDKLLKFCWSVLASTGDNMEMIRDDWEYVGKGPQNGTNLWRKRRLVSGVLPPDAADPARPDEVEDARSARRRRLGSDAAARVGRHDRDEDREARREERQARALEPSDDDE